MTKRDGRRALATPSADRFEALRLNFWTDRSWAVVNASTGAIATLRERLIVRLTEDEARARALALNEAMGRANGPAEVRCEPAEPRTAQELPSDPTGPLSRR